MELERDDVRSIVENVLDSYQTGGCVQRHEGAEASEAEAPAPRADAPARHRVIITALGRNAPGIAAGVTGALADVGADILDMSQTLLGDFFAMIIVADLSTATMDFGMVQEHLVDRGVELGVRIAAQHEDVFRYMHRI